MGVNNERRRRRARRARRRRQARRARRRRRQTKKTRGHDPADEDEDVERSGRRRRRRASRAAAAAVLSLSPRVCLPSGPPRALRPKRPQGLPGVGRNGTRPVGYGPRVRPRTLLPLSATTPRRTHSAGRGRVETPPPHLQQRAVFSKSAPRALASSWNTRTPPTPREAPCVNGAAPSPGRVASSPWSQTATHAKTATRPASGASAHLAGTCRAFHVGNSGVQM